jgi:predicted nucleic acid-binding protein
MRKDAILHHKDGLSNRIDEILGELQRGPSRFQSDCPKARRIAPPPADDQAATAVLEGRPDSLDAPTRLSAEQTLRTWRILEVSRRHYQVSRSIDSTLEQCAEYDIDCRRLGPRFLRVQQIERLLADARECYDDARMRALAKRQEFDTLRDAAAEALEEELKDEILCFGSHVPTMLPLEYSKFSAKVLDAKVREQRSAASRLYDDAAALRSEVIAREKQLDVLSDKFARSFKLQRRTMLERQDRRRETFQVFWERKREKDEAEIREELVRLKKRVEHLEAELADAKELAAAEMSRVSENNRRSLSATAVKPRALIRPTFGST